MEQGGGASAGIPAEHQAYQESPAEHSQWRVVTGTPRRLCRCLELQGSIGWRVFAVARQGSLSPAPAPSLRIGEVARRTGLPVKTIRYYCDEGLLQPKVRSAAGYRLFDQENLAELTIIRALRAMDVSIPELAKILEVRRAGVCNCSVLKDSIAAKMETIDLRISELAAMKGELARLLDSWQDCGGLKADR
jgi:MerR family transcriptional regulator, copper efflux regulator